MKHTIYLAGAITGLSYENATDWREQVSKQLDSESVQCLSPLRGKTYLLQEKALAAEGYSEHVMSTAKGINRRDMWDTMRCSVLFVNLLGASKASIGTAMEIAWAYSKQKPIVIVMEPDNIHQHAMIHDSATYIVPTLEEGVALVKWLLNL